MCGLIGYISKNNTSVKSIFDSNYQSIVPRGKFFIRLDTKDQSIGFSRLPTDGLGAHPQSAIYQTNGKIILFNGLLTNVKYLQNQFSLPPETLHSDTQCLLTGFDSAGKKFIEKCRGMYAFAYITSEEIVLARDTIGIKPLYYVNTHNYFGFCSEIKGLNAESHTKIYEVLPGEIIRYNKKNKKVTKEKFRFKSTGEYNKQDLTKCLIESIILPTKRYLAQSHDKKIGVLISGGIDSSLIAGILNTYLTSREKKRIIGFTIGVPRSSDTHHAAFFAKSLTFPVIHITPFKHNDAINKIKDIVYKVESKFSRAIKVGLLQEALAEKIQAMGIEVVISGEGADELFYGYSRFINGLQKEHINKLYSYFFERVFYTTLLQRFDRIFAQRQIEGRVPFLDQELIVLAKQYSVEEKINYYCEQFLSKIPLRKIARELGLPKEIYLREKMKMTSGVTNEDNTDADDGYLEKAMRKIKNTTVKEHIDYHYATYAYDFFAVDSFVGTEDEAMRQVMYYRENDNAKGVRYFI